MSSYQGGPGDQGRGGRGARGGDQYAIQGRGRGMNPNWRESPSQHRVFGYAGPLGGGQYDNQGHGRGVNPSWSGPPPQHPGAGYAGRANTGQYSNSNPPAQRGPQHGYLGSTARETGPQKMNALQGSGAQSQNQRPQQPRWADRGPQQTVGVLPARFSASTHVHPTTQLIAHEKGDAGLEEQMSALTIQPMTPPPSGSGKVIKFVCRPGKGTRGQRVIIRTNHFLVQLSDKELHHYDVC
jgi:eukaryotic translation initiation factor 2C